jgi:hypothetical protein
MNTHRFSRLRLRVAIGGWFAVLGGLGSFLYQLLTGADFLMSKWPQGKAMPIEVWLFVFGLAWLSLVAFWPELDPAEQPDVALVWDWTLDQKKLSALRNDYMSKVILVHNRSDEWVYNVRISPIALAEQMTFDVITEIKPGNEVPAFGRWGNNKNTQTTNYIYYFSLEKNERMTAQKEWRYSKQHARGLSDFYVKIPMSLSYATTKRSWQWRCNFIFDGDVETMFEKTSSRRV